MARTLVVAGLVLIALGLLVHLDPSIPLGRLPGDIRIERPGLRLYLPIASCVLASLLLSCGLWLFGRLR